MDEDHPHLVILYGMETTNTEDLAKRIAWEGMRRRARIVARPLDFEQFESIENPASTTVFLFILSTMGHGEVPIGVHPFWRKLMRKSLSPTSLSKLSCCVIGLGDSSYPKYNYVGKKLFKRLKQLGANLIADLCLGDDQHDYGYDGFIDPWMEELWKKLTSIHKLPVFTFADDYLPPSTFSFIDSYQEGIFNGLAQSIPFEEKATESSPHQAIVISNRRVTAETHFQDTRLISFQTDERLKYSPGDVLAVRPENDPLEVKDFLTLLSLGPEKVVTMRKNTDRCSLINAVSFSYRHLSGSHTIGDLITKYFDLHAVPKRCFFSLLWKFSDDDSEREKLKELASTTGQEELYSYCKQPKRMIIEVLRDFPKTSAKIPLNYLPDLIPAIRYREFSIASSLKAYPDSIDILMVVVQYQTRIRAMRTGLCSNFLARTEGGQGVTAWINKGSFIIPAGDPPLIMVGPGSGVAPFRGIVQDRVSQGVTDNILFFGCRSEKADFYFEREWKNYVEKGQLLLFTAFSRDQERKIYVQHRIRENSNLIYDWIVNRGAVVLIAGTSTNMPDDVRETLLSIYEEYSEPGTGEAFISDMEVKKRLQYECWD